MTTTSPSKNPLKHLRTLMFPQASQSIVYRTSHGELLSSPEVTRQIVQWLTPPQA